MSAPDPETWMWERARALLEEAERAQRGSFRPGRSAERASAWEPPVDILETPTQLHIQVALPGVAPEDVRVEIGGSELVVHGERPLPEPFHHAAVHRLEIPHGRFERRLTLPAGRYRLARNELVHGCLFLNLEKLER